MKKIWRDLSSEELKNCEEITQEDFGAFRPTILQRFLIFIAQRSFFKRGHLRRLSPISVFIRKTP